jgi:hypothetical protein
MLLVLPEQKLGCVPLLIVRTSCPTIAKPHVVRSPDRHKVYFGIADALTPIQFVVPNREAIVNLSPIYNESPLSVMR